MRFPGSPARRLPLFRLFRRAAPAAAFAVASLLAAHAVALAPGAPALTHGDLVRQRAAVARLNQGRPIGAVDHWRNPKSHNAGEVTLVRSFTARGMPCHTIRYVIHFGSQPTSPRRLVLNWCQLPNKGWKIVELED